MPTSSAPSGSWVGLIPFETLQALAEVSPVPCLKSAVTLVAFVVERVDKVKVYRQNCQELSRQCVDLLLALNDGAQNLDGTSLQQTADEIVVVIARIKNRMERWSTYGVYQSVFRQASIKDGVDASYRDLEHCMRMLNLSAQVEQAHNHALLLGIQARDNAELREMLQLLSQDLAELKSAAAQNIYEVPALMQSLQEELHNTALPAAQERDFRTVLRELHKETALLPPLADLTGQITDVSEHAVAFGGSSDIHVGIWLDEEKVALKRHRTFNSSPAAKRKFLREIEIWRPLKHTSVLPLYGTVSIGLHISLVSPFMEGGNIREYLKDNPDVTKLPLLRQIANGLEYLHSQNVIHGDIRGNNILVSAAGKPFIADFGLSKLQEEVSFVACSVQQGSLRWSAPELIAPELIGLETAPASMESDSWSFGMLCLELLTGFPPFAQMKNDFQVSRALTDGKLPTRPSETSEVTDELWRFMHECWQRDPNLRPSMRETSERFRRLGRLSRGASIIEYYDSSDERPALVPNRFPAPFIYRHPRLARAPTLTAGSSVGSCDGYYFSNTHAPLSSSGSSIGHSSLSGNRLTAEPRTLPTPESSPIRTALLLDDTPDHHLPPRPTSSPIGTSPPDVPQLSGRFSGRTPGWFPALIAASSGSHAGNSAPPQEAPPSVPRQGSPVPSLDLLPIVLPNVEEEDYGPNTLSPVGSPLSPHAPPLPSSPSAHPSGSAESAETTGRTRSRRFIRLLRTVPSPPVGPAVFGRPLAEVLTYAGLEIPVMLRGRQPMYQFIPICVSKCGFWLKVHGLHEIGIFRREGSSSRMRRLQALFDKPPSYGKHLDMKDDYSVADAAGVLRKYVMDLPAPLIPVELYTRFLAMIKPEDEGRSLEVCNELLEEMPRGNRDLLLYMLDLLSTFGKHSQLQRWRPSGPEHPTNMTPVNDLVELFQPALLCDPSQDWWQGEARKCCKVLVFMTERLGQILLSRSVPAIAPRVEMHSLR